MRERERGGGGAGRGGLLSGTVLRRRPAALPAPRVLDEDPAPRPVADRLSRSLAGKAATWGSMMFIGGLALLSKNGFVACQWACARYSGAMVSAGTCALVCVLPLS